jgi:HD superfamily phosphohydrolase
MTKTVLIRDPVHGYLSVLPHEVEIVDHPVTQRLRNILQTGFAYEVFPEARTSRFSHSLGAMHLASRAFGASFENAEPSTREVFLADMRRLRAEAADEPLSVWDDSVLALRGAWAPRVSLNAEDRGLAAWAECAVRLAALFHDVGHLPFSHDFEFALKLYLKRNTPEREDPLMRLCDGSIEIHEEIGLAVAKAFLRDFAAKGSALGPVCWLAAKVLRASTKVYAAGPKPNATAEVWLHSIVDGEIDVDRLDYLLRDGRNLGFEFAQFDLDRLLGALVLTHRDGVGFSTALDVRGIAAAETFFMSRARSNQLMVRHHKVSQLGLAFRHASALALSDDKQLLPRLRALLGGQPTAAAALDFAEVDDSLWTMALRTSRLEGLAQKCRSAALQRGRQLKSVWKRAVDVPDLNLLNTVADDGALFAKFVKRVESDDMLAMRYAFRPYRLIQGRSDSVLHVLVGGGVKPASACSPVLRSLDAWWAADVHAYICGAQDQAQMQRKVEEALRSVATPPSPATVDP